MWIHLLILAVSFGFGAAYNVDMAAWYDQVTGAMADVQTDIFIKTVLGAGLIVLLGVVMAQVNAYALMLPLARLIMEISLFGVSLLAFGSLYFAGTLARNFWFDMGSAALVPFVGLITAAIILYLFDFNYPYKQKISAYLFLAFISLAFAFAV